MPTDPEDKVLPCYSAIPEDEDAFRRTATTGGTRPHLTNSQLALLDDARIQGVTIAGNAADEIRHLRLEIERLREDVQAGDEQMAAVLDGTFAVGDGTAQREIKRLRAELARTAPTWTIEVNDRLSGGRHLVLVDVDDVRADVSLMPAHAYATFGWMRLMRSRVACLLATAAVIRHVDDNPVRFFGNRITPGDYTIQIAGPESWEILRSVFGDVYAAAVL